MPKTHKAWAEAICIRPGGRLFFLMHSPQVTLHSFGCFPPVVHLHGSTKQSIKTYVPVSYVFMLHDSPKKSKYFFLFFLYASKPYTLRIRTVWENSVSSVK